MACYKPLTGYRSRALEASGRRSVVFSRQDGFADLPVQLPCGQCIGCRLERSRQWAVRCMQEASLWDMNCSLTLTYDEANLPYRGSLVPADVQLFMKRLRKYWCVPLGYDDFGNGFSRRLSFFLCGEYGGQFHRPHYHVLLFGVWFGDSRPFKRSKAGFQLYRSDSLDKLWSLGHADIGELNFETAAYAARYVVDKVNGDAAPGHYRGRLPEFVRMSRRPAIGKRWFERFVDDVYPSDTVVARGREMRPPLFYDRLLRREDWLGSESIKSKRALEAIKGLKDRSPARLATRELVARSKLELYR